MKKSWFYRSGHAAATLASALILASCSTFDTEWMRSDAPNLNLEPKVVALEGIPLTMTRPEFLITLIGEGEDKSKPKYSLKVKYVPNPSERYTLKVDPSALADLKFVAQLGDNGELISTTGTVTDRVAPTIKAIGTFVSNAVSFAALADETGSKSKIFETLDTILRCKSVAARVNAFKDFKELVGLFHYLDDVEEICLKDARTKLETGDNPDQEPEKSAIAALKSFVEMDGTVWRARHLLYLERRIAAAEVGNLRGDNNDVEALKIELSRTLGIEKLYSRLQALRAKLDNLPEIAEKNEESVAYKEYNLARLEADALRGKINAARIRVIDAGTVKEAPKPKITEITEQPIKIRTRDYIDAYEANPDRKAPQYIVVMEKVQ